MAKAGSQQGILDLPTEDNRSAVDTGWLLTCAYAVFFMQAGFAMLEAGIVRSKNTKNIIMKNFVDTCIATLCYFGLGYAFAFGNGNGFIGYSYFFLWDFNDYALFIFQWAFCTTSVSIVSGCLAERTQFTSYMVTTAFLATFIYPPISHWAWSEDGWLRTLGSNGFIDYAGGGVVHMVGGGMGLIGAIIVGPRIGRFEEGLPQLLKPPRSTEIPGHSSPLVAIGIFILWFGWFSFNSGSTLGLSNGRFDLAPRIAVNTALASTTGMLAVLLLLRFLTGIYNFEESSNGLLGGAVAITSACAVVEPWTAVFIGAVSGYVYILSVQLLIWLKIDDPLNAAPVHFFCGAWGVISIGFLAKQRLIETSYGFSDAYGLFYGGGVEQLGIQVLGTLAIIAWLCLWSIPLFFGLRYFHMLRVSHDAELAGLDNSKHGGSAYPYFVQTVPDSL